MPKTNLDETDASILGALQRDARLSNLELAAEIELSPSPCLRRVRALQSDGVITAFRAVLDRRKTGLELTVFVTVDIEQRSDPTFSKAFRRAIVDMPEVIACHAVSGGHDFLMEVVVANLEAYRSFLLDRLLRLPMVTKAESSFVIETVKCSSPLPLDHLTTDVAGP